MGIFNIFKKQPAKDTRCHINAIEDFFVVGDSNGGIVKALSGKSNLEMKKMAVDIACQLWGQADVMAWIDARNKLISFGACSPLNDTSALNWVKSNFNVNDYKSFLCKKGRFAGVGDVILVIGLNVSTDKLST